MKVINDIIIFSDTLAVTPLSNAIENDGNHLYYTPYATASGKFQIDQQTTSNQSHTIFTPSTGGTVNLVVNQYNIINPAIGLLTLTVNLPSGPSNNDYVFIKFTQTVSTVTYGNGTVVDGITAPTAGGLIMLVYDSTSTSWY